VQRFKTLSLHGDFQGRREKKGNGHANVAPLCKIYLPPPHTLTLHAQEGDVLLRAALECDVFNGGKMALTVRADSPLPHPQPALTCAGG